jgi:hypothetical protein
MKIHELALPGRRGVVFELDAKTALFLWFHLQGSMHSDVTTRASRIIVAGVLPQLQRAVLATGVVSQAELDGVIRAIQSKPAAPSLDDAVASLKGGA